MFHKGHYYVVVVVLLTGLFSNPITSKYHVPRVTMYDHRNTGVAV